MRAPTLVAAALLLAGCAAKNPDLVVLVPSADGHVGAVSVDDGTTTTTLDEANEAVALSPKGARPVVVPPDEARAIFADALAAAPIPPRRFTVYFEEGTERLTADSQAQLPAILEDVKRRADVEIEIVGHTDRKADAAFNAALSLRRAESVRDWLVSNGVPRDAIAAVGRGEIDPVVPTEDGVAEARNRRVELTVR